MPSALSAVQHHITSTIKALVFCFSQPLLRHSTVEEHPCNGQSNTYCPVGILALLTASCVQILNMRGKTAGTDRNFKCLFQWILSLAFWFLISSVTLGGLGREVPPPAMLNVMLVTGTEP